MKDLTSYIVSVDIGTTNVKAVAFDLEGRQKSKRSVRCRVYSPFEGWAEQRADEILNSVIEAVKSCVKDIDGIVEALAFSSQLYSVAFIDKDGNILSPILNWMDSRSKIEAFELSEAIGGYEIYRRTGCHISPIMPASKILWFRKNNPEMFSRVYKVLSIKDYVLYRLLNVYVMDKILASATALFNIHRGRWDSEIVETIGLDMDKLPEVVEPESIVGQLKGFYAEKIGLPNGTPVVCGGGDGMLQNLGLGVLKSGIAALNIGTSGAVRVSSNRITLDKSRKARFFCHSLAEGYWCIGGAINSAGLSFEWFAENFLGGDFNRIEVEASKAKPGSNGLIFLPYLLDERAPLWCTAAKAVLYGLSLKHSLSDVTRAVLEGVVFALNHIRIVLEKYVPPVREIRAGGGGAKIDLLNQIQADVFQTPVFLTSTEESSSLGAAILAAKTLGYYGSLNDACNSTVKITKVFKPIPENSIEYYKLFEKYCKISNHLYKYFFKPSENLYSSQV
ncbi:MAG: FGGY family carbohydrate kinase [Candidatus Bathyarchaeia archaeon]